MGLRSEVFYRTDTIVRTGDEFYQLDLELCSDSKELSYRVRLFHGFYGKPPKKASRNESFDTRVAAEDKFSQIVSEIKGQGFFAYSKGIHGLDNF
jgi:hypothetical protein